MKKKFLSCLSVLFVSMMFLTVPAVAQEFSADMVSTAEGKTMNAKIYASGDKVRMDMADNVMIIRRDKNLSWIVMPSEKMYMEHPVNLSTAPKVQTKYDSEIERVSMGNETVNGMQTEKFKVTYTEDNKSVSVYQWIKDGVFPVKIEAVDGSFKMEYKNIVTGPQPADLFEPPAGYEKMEMPSMGDMMKGMGGMGDMPDMGSGAEAHGIGMKGVMKGLKGMIGE